MAVELAKLALWLETVAADAPLTFLDHHLRCGDSLIGTRVQRMAGLPGDDNLFASQFAEEIQTALPTLMQPLNEISQIPSDTAEHVKKKERIFRRQFLPSLDRFSQTANVWTAEALEQGTVVAANYASLVAAVGSKRKFDAEIATEWAQRALSLLKDKQVIPFHWELGYPEVFLSSANSDRGFDVIIGNPPYDVLSELETGHSVEHFKRFIAMDPTLQPSLVGKNNLYKLFICRCLELLADNGYLSFIVPMALLGDEQSSGVRRAIVSSGSFTEIHAFPQKDNPARRVFRDAKLSTTLFVYQKSLEFAATTSFHSYVHPVESIEFTSLLGLDLDGNSIKTYDPENRTIVSYAKLHWDLMKYL